MASLQYFTNHIDFLKLLDFACCWSYIRKGLCSLLTVHTEQPGKKDNIFILFYIYKGKSDTLTKP